MITDLPDGTLIQFNHRGQPEVWKLATHIVPEGDRYRTPGTVLRVYGGVQRPIVAGEQIHVGVWKGDQFEVRRVHTVREGEFEWVQVGIGQIGATRGQPIFANRRTR